jgi:hypothetical protein
MISLLICDLFKDDFSIRSNNLIHQSKNKGKKKVAKENKKSGGKEGRNEGRACEF